MAISGMFLSRGLTLGLYDFVKKFGLKDPQNSGIMKRFMIANAVTQSVNLMLYPMDTVGRTLMMQSGAKIKQFKNPLDCLRKIVKYQGAKGLYKGALSDAVTGLGSSLVLVLYDDLKKAVMGFTHKH